MWGRLKDPCINIYSFLYLLIPIICVDSIGMKTYYSLLDPVRFFAAFWVMNYHYLFVIGLSNNLNWYRYGNLGVQLFFIISGFVIIESLQGKTFKEFATSRFIRIVPIFWILCTATYLLTLFVPGAKIPLFSEYMISMTMFADIINGAARNHLNLVDPAYWTLTVELIFYLTIAIFTYFFSFKKIRYFLLSWFVISVLSFIYKVDQTFIMKLFLVRHASYFIFGSALALIATKEAENTYEKYFDWTLLFSSAIYSVFIHTKAIPAYLSPLPIDNTIISLLIIIFFIGVFGLVYLSPYIKNKKVIKMLLVLGTISYPLYLIHQKIGNTLINYFTNTFNLSWNTVAICFEVFIILIAYLISVQDKKMRLWLKMKMN